MPQFPIERPMNTPPIVQGPKSQEIIDPRAEYERQSRLAEQMMQGASQYQGGGIPEALAMIINAYGANKAGKKAEGSLSAALEQEAEKERQAMIAEQRAQQEKMEAELQNAMRLKQFESQNQPDPSVIREMQAAGIDPRSPEGQRRILQGTGPGTSVNVNMGEEGRYLVGKDAGLPPGWRFDQQSGQAERIPGGPAEVEQQQQAEQAGAATNERQGKSLYDEVTGDVRSQNINEVADEVLENISPWSTGLGSSLSGIGGTPAADLSADLKVLQSDQVLGRMEEMKNQSSTGATGFGAMNKPELELLMSDRQALLQNQSGPELAKAVERWKEQWNTTNAIDALSRKVENGEVPIEEAKQVADRIRAENQQKRAEITEKYGGGENTEQQSGNPEIDDLLKKYGQ